METFDRASDKINFKVNTWIKKKQTLENLLLGHLHENW